MTGRGFPVRSLVLGDSTGNHCRLGGAMTESQEKPFLERPLAIVTLVGGVLGLLGTGVGIYTGLAAANRGDPTPPAAASSPAVALSDSARVAECQRTHGLAQPSEKREAGEGQWYLRACAWPAPDGASPDGFSEITLRSEPGPGQSEAEGMTVADIYTSTCRELEVTYLFNNQGTFVPEQPVRLGKGEVRRVEGGSIVAGSPAGRDQSVIYSSGRYRFDSVRCR